ncbi:MAG TPA: pyridoxamine 5'-phosphate oxidase [Kiritimatiellia bacterium]|nr:pyridoxamine 5'-phosphate oxidase [Kiritimatiellia bacterium]
MRKAYDRGALAESDLAPAPLPQFARWLREAAEAGMAEPNAMVLATADAAGRPSSRLVLLKGVDAAGFRFFTNRRSRKARALAENPQVALLFPWHDLHRQVEVRGAAEPMSADESAAYFKTRPRESQLAAWASRQSAPLAGRAELEKRLAELRARWPEGTEIPAPEFWGGYLVRAESVEFWHGRESRLHDRLRYEALRPAAPLDDPAAWQVRRYAP